MDSRFWQYKTNRPDGRHRARGIDCQETFTTRGRRCITQQVRPYSRGAVGSGCHPLHPNRGRCPPWPQNHRSLGATTRVAVCLPRYAHDPIPSVKFARVQNSSSNCLAMCAAVYLSAHRTTTGACWARIQATHYLGIFIPVVCLPRDQVRGSDDSRGSWERPSRR
jgi:hypothetical protein